MSNKFSIGQFVKSVIWTGRRYVVTSLDGDWYVGVERLDDDSNAKSTAHVGDLTLDVEAMRVVADISRRSALIAKEAGYCSEYDRIAAAVGLSKVKTTKKFRVAVDLKQTVYFDVEAEDTESAMTLVKLTKVNTGYTTVADILKTTDDSSGYIEREVDDAWEV